jgi:hypothetical protein
MAERSAPARLSRGIESVDLKKEDVEFSRVVGSARKSQEGSLATPRVKGSEVLP